MDRRSIDIKPLKELCVWLEQMYTGLNDYKNQIENILTSIEWYGKICMD